MSLLRLVATILFCSGMMMSSALAEEAEMIPEHYHNDPANIHEDPNHTPGDYALGDTYTAKLFYESVKNNLIEPESLLEGEDLWITLGLGELSFKSVKNESAEVLGYFRDYRGVLKQTEEGLEMLMAININSLDTAVPGRNNRILDIFFNSVQPELSVATVQFDQFDLGELAFEDLKDGEVHEIGASGTLRMNEVTKPIQSKLSVQFRNATWHVKTLEPLMVSIADYAFGDRIHELMKACNHKSMGNNVKVEVELYLK